MKQYDGLYILNIQGKEEGLKDAIDTIEKEITTLGGLIKGTQKMDKRKFERMSGNLDAGFYVNVQFSLTPEKVEGLRQKLSLNNLVFRQFYIATHQTATPKPKAKAATTA